MSSPSSMGGNALRAYDLLTRLFNTVEGVREGLRSAAIHPFRVWSSSKKVPQETKKAFVVLIFICYDSWERESNGKSMQLNSVKNDLTKLLTHLKYLHDDVNTTWHFLIDFDCEFVDAAGTSRPLPRIDPTKRHILDALEKAGRDGGSGLVYFGGHGELEPPGTSHLGKRGEKTLYTVKQRMPFPRRAFLLASDGGRIYGKDIFSRLPEHASAERVHTVALDACHSSGVADGAGDLQYVYDGIAEVEDDPKKPKPRSSKQLITVTAAHKGETSGTVRPDPPDGPLYGSLTWYMLHWLDKHSDAPAEYVARRLYHRCVECAAPKPPHHPQIKARHPLEGSFRLLPDTTRSREDINEVVDPTEPGPSVPAMIPAIV